MSICGNPCGPAIPVFGRIRSEFTYCSGIGKQLWYFTIVVDENGVSVRNITTPFGLLHDSMTQLPQQIIDDIENAVTQAEDLVGLSSPINGQITFTAETTQSVVFATALAGTTYRVLIEPPEFISWRVVNKSTTGFDVELSATFTGTLGYDVFI